MYNSIRKKHVSSWGSRLWIQQYIGQEVRQGLPFSQDSDQLDIHTSCQMGIRSSITFDTEKMCCRIQWDMSHITSSYHMEVTAVLGQRERTVGLTCSGEDERERGGACLGEEDKGSDFIWRVREQERETQRRGSVLLWSAGGFQGFMVYHTLWDMTGCSGQKQECLFQDWSCQEWSGDLCPKAVNLGRRCPLSELLYLVNRF